MAESGVTPQRGQTLVSEEGLKKMGKELVRLCDGIERHGLVDYEYGVWEEAIVESRQPTPGGLASDAPLRGVLDATLPFSAYGLVSSNVFCSSRRLSRHLRKRGRSRD